MKKMRACGTLQIQGKNKRSMNQISLKKIKIRENDHAFVVLFKNTVEQEMV